MSGAVLRFLPDEEESGLRLDKFLAGRLASVSRSMLQKLIQNGNVTVEKDNGKNPSRASDAVFPGQTITVFLPDPEPSETLPQNLPLDILYEDEDVLLVNKPAGQVVHPSAGHSDGTLVNAVLYHCKGRLSGIGGVERPGIVHRIDKDTSGVLLICKNDAAHRNISAQLKEHSIHRIYRGIVYGTIKETEGTIRGNIGRDPRDRKKMAIVSSGGKPAVTHYRLLELLREFSYMEFSLETGRTHQIRVHMASIHHPLAGDPLYGPKKGIIPAKGQYLHAMTLGFLHPKSGEYMEFSADLPDAFQNMLEQSRR